MENITIKQDEDGVVRKETTIVEVVEEYTVDQLEDLELEIESLEDRIVGHADFAEKQLAGLRDQLSEKKQIKALLTNKVVVEPSLEQTNKGE